MPHRPPRLILGARRRGLGEEGGDVAAEADHAVVAIVTVALMAFRRGATLAAAVLLRSFLLSARRTVAVLAVALGAIAGRPLRLADRRGCGGLGGGGGGLPGGEPLRAAPAGRRRARGAPPGPRAPRPAPEPRRPPPPSR